MLAYLRRNKRYWLPPLLIFAAILLYLAWKAATAPGSPFAYKIR